MIFGRELVVAIVLGFALAWAYHRFAVPRGAPAFPVIIAYNKIGSATDRLGVPFLTQNPGR